MLLGSGNLNQNIDGLKKSNEEINKLTRESIQEALTLLMSSQDLNSISVTDIANKAGVSRSAYYKNYQFKEEIIRDFLKRVYDTIMADVLLDELNDNPYKTFYSIFTAIKDNLKLIEQLIQAKLKYPIHYLWKGKNNNYTKLEIFTLNCFEVSFTHLVKEWVEDKTTVSIEDIALLSTNLYPEIKLLSKKI